jgi:hypothetical protein
MIVIRFAAIRENLLSELKQEWIDTATIDESASCTKQKADELDSRAPEFAENHKVVRIVKVRIEEIGGE